MGEERQAPADHESGMEPELGIQVGDFADVDRSSNPPAMVEWMARQRTGPAGSLATLLDVQPGERVLDLGCGPGGDLQVLATAAGQDGRVIGVDRSLTMAQAARSASPVIVADGAHLPLADGSIDAVWIRAVLIHTPDPPALVSEAARVLRPGGRVTVSEPDHGSHIVSPCDPELLERIRTSRRRRFQHPTIGRDLPRLLSSAGLITRRVDALTIVQRDLAAAKAGGGPFGQAVHDAVADGLMTADEAESYELGLENAHRQGAFLFLATAVMAAAELPDH